MSDVLCRLCLNSDNVVDLFHPDLTNSEVLQTCILLATGINISPDDVVTKYVCASCCDMSVKQCKFRKTALANDNALKLALKQTCIEVPLNVDDTVARNTSIMVKLLLHDEPPSKPVDSYTVHPSVVRLFKTNQNLIIPTDLVKVNLDPKIYVKPLDGNDLPEEFAIGESDPIDVFKAKCPAIIVKGPESRKRPYVDTDVHVQTKRSKVNDIIVTYEQNNNVEPKRKSDSKVTYKIVESKSGKENVGSTNKIVLARVSSNESSDYVHDSPLSSNSKGVLNPTESPPLNTLHPRKARPSFFLRDYEVDLDSSEVLLETAQEEEVYNCELCNRFFNDKLKLKAHKRYHKKCLVCNVVCRSNKALSYHQTNVCFKQMVDHLPTLCLPKCDDSEEIKAIQLRIPTIELPFGNDEGDAFLISDDEEPTIKDLDKTEETYIKSIFNKYKMLFSLKPSTNYKHENTGTDSLLDATITNNEQHTAVIVEGMFPFIQSLLIPIQHDIQIQPEMSARLEPKQIQREVLTTEMWSGKIKELSKKPLILNGQQISLPIAVPKVSSSKNEQAKLQTDRSISQFAPQPAFAPQMQPNNAGQKKSQAVAQKQQMAGQSIAQKPTQIYVQNFVSNEKQKSAVNGFLRVKSPWKLM